MVTVRPFAVDLNSDALDARQKVHQVGSFILKEGEFTLVTDTLAVKPSAYTNSTFHLCMYIMPVAVLFCLRNIRKRFWELVLAYALQVCLGKFLLRSYIGQLSFS